MGGTTGEPFDNLQPSLAVTEFTPLFGVFPSGGGGGSAIGDTLGFIYAFAGNFVPGGGVAAQGQLLPINQNAVVFDLLGTTYGGNGTSNFAVPNLQGTAAIGAGTGPGLSPQTLGVATGSATVALSSTEIPPNDPSLPGGGDGGGQAYSNLQPSLPVQQLIAVSGVFPSQGGGSGSATFIGQVASFAGDFIPAGWMAADGQLLSIAQNTALFSIIGTTYGGNGTTTFALPDLRGRVAVGADGTNPLGTISGQETTTLTSAQLPGGGIAGSKAPGQPVNNDQPSLSLNYLIATSGIFPTQDGDSLSTTTPILGQITEFAGNFAPSGWAFANGQLLSISQNVALFSIIGTQFGGDGVNTFALPDLRGRTLIGTGTNDNVAYLNGETFGTDTTTLAIANLPLQDQPVCFCAGTRIATPDGEVEVELLSVGDAVLTAAGEVRSIAWIGSGRVAASPKRRGAAAPVIVRKSALAPNVPNRDLHITQAHSLYLDGVLIPVEYLINHRSIVWDDEARDIEIYHVELETHDVLLANGAPAESYRDDGNRSLFQNARTGWDQPPKPPCAPVLTGGPIVDAVWRWLLNRSGLRLSRPTTGEPDLHLLVDGRRVEGRETGNGLHVFRLTKPPMNVRVVSRADTPDELGLARDPRRLGVALRQILLWRGRDVRPIDAEDAALRDGFHAFEADNGFRWTDGNARLPGRLFEGIDGACELELQVAATTRYRLLETEANIAA